MRWGVSKQRSEIERLGEILGFMFKPREGRSDERKPPSWWCWCDEKKKKKTHTKGVFSVNIAKSELYLRYRNC